jgi:simple sugar transport system ATP-binding protein
MVTSPANVSGQAATAAAPAAAVAPFLEMIEISKTFIGVRANDRITFQVLPGEVHALLGENGAGKSTLMNILYGLLRPDEGEIWVAGQKVSFASPGDAIRHGIGMVHQHFALVPTLTVAENVAVGLDLTPGPMLRLGPIVQKIDEVASACGIYVEPKAMVADLPVGDQQRVEILKALCREAQLIVMDEPTAVLTPAESRELFKILRQLRDEGRSVILISHKLEEIMEISDRITVLRDGRVVQTIATRDADRCSLARMMVGRDVSLQFDRPPAPSVRQTLMDVRNLAVSGHPGLRNINLSIAAGEILGVAGVDGNGQTELAHAIAGLLKIDTGSIIVDGEDFTSLPSRERALRALAYIPEDRHGMGVVLDFAIADNVVLRRYREFTRFGLLNRLRIFDHARSLCERFGVKTPSLSSPMRKLSGGNQQRVVIAREISSQPRVVLAVHPTRGLDVGATEYVLKSMLDLRARGAAVLYVSAELEEILAISDRIAVMFEGEIRDVVSGSNVDIEHLGLLMTGSNREATDSTLIASKKLSAETIGSRASHMRSH